jgi:hypothetical protein
MYKAFPLSAIVASIGLLTASGTAHGATLKTLFPSAPKPIAPTATLAGADLSSERQVISMG